MKNLIRGWVATATAPHGYTRFSALVVTLPLTHLCNRHPPWTRLHAPPAKQRLTAIRMHTLDAEWVAPATA